MSVLIKVDHEKETVHLPVRYRGIYPVDKMLVKRSGVPLPVRGVKVNNLSPLWPGSYFRDAMLSAAGSWVSQMQKRGYELASHEGDVEVWGPYKPKPWSDALGADPHVAGLSDLEGHLTDTADFLLYADFVATHGKVNVEDHERLDQLFGKEYDRVLKGTNYNVLEAMAKLEGQAGPSGAAQVSLDLLIERERKGMAPYGGY